MTQPFNDLANKLPPYHKGDNNFELLMAQPAFNSYHDLYGFNALKTYHSVCSVGIIKGVHYNIACMSWQQKAATADVLIAHGLFDHMGVYVPLIKVLLDAGFSVYISDLPEHGLSSGMFGELSSFQSYSQALDTVIKENHLGQQKPLYALGHSTGCAAIMRYLLDCQNQGQPHLLMKVILLCPLIRVQARPIISLLYTVIHYFIRTLPRRMNTQNSHDHAFGVFIKHRDPLQLKKISVAWVKAMLDWESDFEALNTQLIDGLLIQAMEDVTVNKEKNFKAINKVFPKFKQHRIEGAWHHLVREGEPWRSQTYDLILKELKNCC